MQQNKVSFFSVPFMKEGWRLLMAPQRRSDISTCCHTLEVPTNRLNCCADCAAELQTPAALQGGCSPTHSPPSNLETGKDKNPAEMFRRSRTGGVTGAFFFLKKKKILFLLLCWSVTPHCASSIPHWLKTVFQPEGQAGVSLYLQIVRLKKETQWAGKRGVCSEDSYVWHAGGWVVRERRFDD